MYLKNSISTGPEKVNVILKKYRRCFAYSIIKEEILKKHWKKYTNILRPGEYFCRKEVLGIDKYGIKPYHGFIKQNINMYTNVLDLEWGIGNANRWHATREKRTAVHSEYT